MSVNKRSFALLVDGDNAQPALIPQILEKMSEYGDILIKRVYGDWSQDQLKSWREVVLRHAFETPHRFNGSTNKNATDISLVIDAMDILWGRANEIDGFCIVSSDSDFTHLVARIRQSNLTVIGIGKKDTSSSFKDVCNIFITTEELKNPKSSEILLSTPETPVSKPSKYTFETIFIEAYESCINKNVQNDGFVPLQDIRTIIKDLDTESLIDIPQKMLLFVAQAKEFAESFRSFIEIQELLDNKPVIHLIRLNSEIIKFWIAYKRAVEVYRFTDTDDWVTLSAIEYAYNELFSIKYGNTKKFLKAIRKNRINHPSIVEIYDHADGEEITHYIRIGKENTGEIDKFYHAYEEVISLDKVSHQDGWIALSPLGSTVRKLYPDYDPLTYRGTKYSQLRKVLAIMCQIYPNRIELKTGDSTIYVRIKK